MNIKLAYTRAEAAEACGVAENFITAAIRKGTLRAKRSGKSEDGKPAGKYLIRQRDLEAWLDTLEDA